MKSTIIRLAQAAPALSNPIWRAIYPNFRRNEYWSGEEYDDRASAFDTIYQENRWGSDESRSGRGSTMAQTQLLRRELPLLFQRLGVTTFLDAPCGDFYWMRHVPMGQTHYIGGDIVPDLIGKLKREHPDRDFRVMDIVEGPIPKADLWLCRDTLFHLPNADVQKVLTLAAHSGVRFFLMTTYPFAEENRDIKAGGFRFLNLQAAPFNLPPPILSIDDFSVPEPPRVLGLWSAEQLRGQPAT